MPQYQSETSKHRDTLLPFCRGYGLDIGFGGDPVSVNAIRLDFPEPYAQTGSAAVQLGGDCRHLFWFQDDVLDFVYSSHVLEDFAESETLPIITEWARVLRPGGHLVLLLPDQQRYLRHCERENARYNEHHSIDHFSLRYVTEVAGLHGNLEAVAAFPELGEYSFGVVFKKTRPTAQDADQLVAARRQLEEAYRQRDAVQLRMNRIQMNPAYRLARSIYRRIAH